LESGEDDVDVCARAFLLGAEGTRDGGWWWWSVVVGGSADYWTETASAMQVPPRYIIKML